jgi:hypothetical protein
MDALEKNTHLGLTVPVIDRALPGENVVDIGVIDLGARVDHHEVIARTRADHGGKQQKEKKGEKRVAEECEHIRPKDRWGDGKTRRAAATTPGTGRHPGDPAVAGAAALGRRRARWTGTAYRWLLSCSMKKTIFFSVGKRTRTGPARPGGLASGRDGRRRQDIRTAAET